MKLKKIDKIPQNKRLFIQKKRMFVIFKCYNNLSQEDLSFIDTLKLFAEYPKLKNQLIKNKLIF